MGMSARIDTVVDIETLRSPILTLPEDIDAAWFRDWVPISNRQIRLFHAKWGETIRRITGFTWPPERPGVDAVYDLLPEAARYPYFLRLFLEELEPGPFEKRTYFKRLVSRYVDALRASGINTHAPKDAETTGQQLAELAARGRGDVSTAVVLLEWSAQPTPDKPLSMFNVAEALPGLRSYILTYMACWSEPFETLLAGDPLPMTGTPMEGEEPEDSYVDHSVRPDAVQGNWNDAIAAMARLLVAARNVPPDASLVGALEDQLSILDEAVKQHSLDHGPRTTEEISHRAAPLLTESPIQKFIRRSNILRYVGIAFGLTRFAPRRWRFRAISPNPWRDGGSDRAMRTSFQRPIGVAANRASMPATSPATTACFDIFAPPPGDSDVISHFKRLSSNETKIAPRSMRIPSSFTRLLSMLSVHHRTSFCLLQHTMDGNYTRLYVDAIHRGRK